MKTLPAALGAQLVELVAQRTGRARVAIAGSSMAPLLRAGMVVDIEPLVQAPRIGDILVFRSQTGLVAHRLVGGESFALGPHGGLAARKLFDERTCSFLTSGDAYPDRAEVVPHHLVVGRVTAVWSSAEPSARRVDKKRFRWLGSIYARTRMLRSFGMKIRAYTALLVDPAMDAGPGAFSALVTATRDFEQLRYAAGVAELSGVPQGSLIDTARRHHASGLIAHWLDLSRRAGFSVPDDLHDAFRRIRWTNLCQAGRVLACARDVRDRFVAADIPHIFLKGGARLAAAESGADLQFCGDLDVMVPAELADSALAALREGGYRDLFLAHERVRFAVLHHREPLCLPESSVPVEVHVALAPPGLVGQRLDFTALAPMSRTVDGPLGPVCVLDEVAAAVHLAYHARDLHVWRDIVLLSRLLREFDATARARFDAYVKAETRDALRVSSAVAAAQSPRSRRHIAYARTATIYRMGRTARRPTAPSRSLRYHRNADRSLPDAETRTRPRAPRYRSVATLLDSKSCLAPADRSYRLATAITRIAWRRRSAVDLKSHRCWYLVLRENSMPFGLTND